MYSFFLPTRYKNNLIFLTHSSLILGKEECSYSANKHTNSYLQRKQSPSWKIPLDGNQHFLNIATYGSPKQPQCQYSTELGAGSGHSVEERYLLLLFYFEMRKGKIGCCGLLPPAHKICLVLY